MYGAGEFERIAVWIAPRRVLTEKREGPMALPQA
jgi:hypothetical protein